ncbi:MAG: tetratricopeptide repeat protein [Sulfurospirillaceae bacterium]|nr:tetratricopeptide repeat protein [Sulfurospirillaceae bacterium]
MADYLEQGITVFFEKKFKEAMHFFSLELSQNPLSQQARIGAILSDMALSTEDQALALFEYYLVNKENGTENCEEMIEEIVSAVENQLDPITNLFSHRSFEDKINAENGIRYEDFLALIKSRGTFKEAFEDIMFSTKVIISKKEDFVDFLAQLIDNGFEEISLNYLESAVSIFPNDEQLLSLIKKVHK